MKALQLIKRFSYDKGGQATLEAAFLIPIMFLLLLLLIQPALILYDRAIMQSAAAEGCRLLATKTSATGDMHANCEAFIRHRLAAIPPIDCMHVHGSGCSYDIQLNGAESSAYVSVVIETEVKPLPLVDFGSSLLGLTNAQGNFTLRSEVSMPTQPSWIWSSVAGSDPSSWVGAWTDV